METFCGLTDNQPSTKLTMLYFVLIGLVLAMESGYCSADEVERDTLEQRIEKLENESEYREQRIKKLENELKYGDKQYQPEQYNSKSLHFYCETIAIGT